MARLSAVTAVLVLTAACGGQEVASTAVTSFPDTEVVTNTATITTVGGDSGLVGELESAEQQWVAAGVSDYTLVVEYGCFCVPERRGPFEVAVRNGEVTEVLFDGEVIQPQAGITPVEVFTVEGLFGEIRASLDADKITVTYDQRGIPTLIDIDPIEDAVDDELTIMATLTSDETGNASDASGEETSGFSGASDTAPPPFGDSLTLPLAEGFGVVCSGSTGHDEATFVRLEGPFSGGAEFDAVVSFYESFVTTEGFEVTRMLDEPDWVALDGWDNDPEGGVWVVSVTIRPTIHSTTVVAARAIERAAFGLAADAMDTNDSCWSGGELHDAAAGVYQAFGGEVVSEHVVDP